MEAWWCPWPRRWLRLSGMDWLDLCPEASQSDTEACLSTGGGSFPVFREGGSHTSFSHWLLLETTWHHLAFYTSSFMKLSRSCNQEACRNSHVEPQTHSLCFPLLLSGLLDFSFVSFSEVKLMVRGSLWIEGQCWGNPWLENFTEEATPVEKQKGKCFWDWYEG